MNKSPLLFRVLTGVSLVVLGSILFYCKKSGTTTTTTTGLANCKDTHYFYNDGTGKTGTGILLPNAFTPNGDGINDIYRPVYKNVTNYTLTIKDSKGTTLYTTTNPDSGWNGRNKSGSLVEDYYTASVGFTDTKGTAMTKSLTIAAYQYHGGCLTKNSTSCVFGDQGDPQLGIIYPTYEKICK
jgi:gliding motility-associated-like protein